MIPLSMLPGTHKNIGLATGFKTFLSSCAIDLNIDVNIYINIQKICLDYKQVNK